MVSSQLRDFRAYETLTRFGTESIPKRFDNHFHSSQKPIHKSKFCFKITWTLIHFRLLKRLRWVYTAQIGESAALKRFGKQNEFKGTFRKARIEPNDS